MEQDIGDPALPSGSRASTEPQDASPPSASIPIANRLILLPTDGGDWIAPQSVERVSVQPGWSGPTEVRTYAVRNVLRRLLGRQPIPAEINYEYKFPPFALIRFTSGKELEVECDTDEEAAEMVREIVTLLAQGIVTQRDETRSGSAERSEVEPDGEADALKVFGNTSTSNRQPDTEQQKEEGL